MARPPTDSDAIRTSEDPILSALLAAKQRRKESRRAFQVRGALLPVLDADGLPTGEEAPLMFDTVKLDRTDVERCRQAATHRGEGLERAIETRDEAEYDCRLLVAATTAEDRKRLWGNNAYMRALGVAEPWRMVNAILDPGDIAEIVVNILEHSGFKEDRETVDQLKSPDSD